MKLVIAGASGSIGRNFLVHAPHDWEIVALYNSSNNFLAFVESLKNNNIKAVRCDLLSADETEKTAQIYFNGCTHCLFLVAVTSVNLSIKEPQVVFDANLKTLVNFLKYWNGKRFIFLSSDSLYEGQHGAVSPKTTVTPTLPYSIAKLAGEQYIRFIKNIRGNDFSYFIFRLFGLFGSHDHAGSLCNRLADTFFIKQKHEFTVFGDCNNMVDILYADDVAMYLQKALTSEAENMIVDCCSGNPLTITELIQTAAQAFGIEILKIIHEERPDQNSYLQRYYRGNNIEVSKVLGYSPKTTIHEGFRKLGIFLKEQTQR